MRALALAMSLLAFAAYSNPVVQTPGVSGPDTPVVAILLCGQPIALVESTPEGAAVLWMGLMLPGRVAAIDDRESAAIELSAQYPGAAEACRRRAPKPKQGPSA